MRSITYRPHQIALKNFSKSHGSLLSIRSSQTFHRNLDIRPSLAAGVVACPRATRSVHKKCSPFDIHAKDERPSIAPKQASKSYPQATDLHPFDYTSGRWITREAQELEARRINFDFDALCRRVIQACPGALSIKSCTKKEGGFNRVFLFVLDNDKRVAAKLPFSVAGPPSLTTNSEIATIKYLQLHTKIPIPAVLEWSDDPSNVVGSEYILLDHAKGVHLHERWMTMDAVEKINLTGNISRISQEMTELEFPAYGSLYLKSKRVDTSTYIHLKDDIYIGPHCGVMFWKSHAERSHCPQNHGPWCDLLAYADGLIDAGISRTPTSTVRDQKLPRYHGSVSAHMELLESGRRVLRKMASDPRIRHVADPTLFHPDLHKRNIFVSEDDPAVVTSIIDWQSTSIEPAFWYADQMPDFAEARDDDSDPASQLCAKAWEGGLQYLNERIGRPCAMDESLFRPFRYCHRTWKDGAVAFRHEMIETARLWDELGLEGPCPYPTPDPEKLRTHLREYRLFEAAQSLRTSLAKALNVDVDGWVPCDAWEEAKVVEKQMFDGILNALLQSDKDDPDEPLRTEEDLREIWPFDL